MIVDTHCHVSPSWYEPVELLLHQMDRNGVDKAVLIQMRGQSDNEHQFECVRRNPDRLVSVVVVDTSRPDAPDELARLADRGARGVRLFADMRSPGPDPFVVWRKAAELGLPVSSGSPWTETAADEIGGLLETTPNLTLVIEHLGASSRSAGEPYERRRKVLSLARFPNVYVKIHGLGEYSERAMPVVEPFPFVRPIPLILDMAIEMFGPARMMWGSDYPPVSGREGYANALRLTMGELANQSQVDRDLIFGGTAASVFRL